MTPREFASNYSLALAVDSWLLTGASRKIANRMNPIRKEGKKRENFELSDKGIFRIKIFFVMWLWLQHLHCFFFFFREIHLDERP